MRFVEARAFSLGSARSVRRSSAGSLGLGRFLGTDVTSTAALPNHFGVTIANQAQYTNVGEQSAASVISGNAYDGVYISDAGTRNNAFQVNPIGIDAKGSYDSR